MTIKKPSSLKKPKQPLLPMPTAKAPAKKFTVESWNPENVGKRILIYADTGIGKTSLAMLAPKPVFIALDDGGRELTYPDGSHSKMIPGIETFSNVRSALQQHDLFADYETAIVDTVTLLQDWAETYVVENITTDKGAKVKNILGYGYNKGFKHLYNTMKLILQDCDALVMAGKNVILLAQGINHNVPNPGGEDFLRHGLRLHVDKSWDIESLYCEWSNHLLRISYYDTMVSKDRKIVGSTTRAVFAQPEPHFRAKSRTVTEPIVSFADKTDDSIWQYIFKGGE